MNKLTLTQIRDKIKSKEISSVEATEACLKAIDDNKDLNALNYVDYDGAVKRAKEIDDKNIKGEDIGRLGGVPIILKDNICNIGMPTTCSSKILQGFMPFYNAFVTDKLLNSGAVILGKANMDEFAMGSSNETSFTGKVKNPVNKDYVPGGSSGGSAASVAANLCYAALGTDTGGSIRQPASLCGIVGFKPTYGTVSRRGVVAFASSLDQVGPLTKNVKDCVEMMRVISGHDESDSTSIRTDTYPKYELDEKYSLKNLKIGVPTDFLGLLKDEEVKRAIDDSIKVLKDNGAEIVELKMKALEYAIPVYYILASAEAASNLARYDGIKYAYRSQNYEDLIDIYYASRSEGFGAEVKRRIMLGNYVLSSGYFDAYYKKAQKVQTLIRQEFSKAFLNCDLILTPTSPTPAFKIGEKQNDVLSMYLSDVFTVPVNIAGVAAINLPCGKSNDGLPIGAQLISPHLKEDILFNASNVFERVIK